MITQRAEIVDRQGRIVATMVVADCGTHFGGDIDLKNTPAELRGLFDEFEEVIDQQAFSDMDELLDRIGGFQLRANCEDGRCLELRDFQVFPSVLKASFRTPEMWTRFREDAERRRVVPEFALTTPTPSDPNTHG